VTTAIDTKRTEALGLIQANLKKTKESYPIDAAIRDVNAYHQLCSFSTGIQLVMEAVEKQQAYEDAIKLGQIESELIRLGRDLDIAGLDTSGGQAIAAQMNRLRQERILRTTGFDLAPPSPQDASEQDTSGAEGEATEETPAAADDPA
jgi:hypothetical protein